MTRMTSRLAESPRPGAYAGIAREARYLILKQIFTVDLMPAQIEVLNAHRHRHLKLLRQGQSAHTESVDTMDVMLAEFRPAATAYAIVFIQEQGGIHPQPVLLDPGRNSNHRKGAWNMHYLPQVLRVHPFTLMMRNGSDDPLIGIDRDSPLISETEGEPLFLLDGRLAPTTSEIMSLLARLNEAKRETSEFCRHISALDWFTPLGGNGSIYLRIDAARLEQADHTTLHLLRKRGWLTAIYAHLISLTRFERSNAHMEEMP